MEIAQELVERIAQLARLTLSEDEKTRMSAQLGEILGSVTALEALCLEEELPEEDGREDLRSGKIGQGGEGR